MRVLVIEDEPRILEFLREALLAAGVAVDGVATGEEGLQAAAARRYDLVVLDLMLPGAKGLRVLQELKRLAPDLAVLILSARSELPTKLRGFELGASDYLTKPFSLDEFVARVRVQLRHADQRRVTVRAGPLELDLVRRQARLDGVAADLSEREFALLRHLVQGAGQVISRERLLADVWGIEFDPGTNVVDVCVRRLRKKLGPQAPIRTVRNVGYWISVDGSPEVQPGLAVASRGRESSPR
jgi:DNA-binding response OmpR family regulator